MNAKMIGPLKALLWLICAFHLIVGVGLNLSSGFPQVMAGYYGATVNWTPEFLYIVKPIGAFMIAMAIVAGAAAMDPLSHRSSIYALVALFVIRGLQRLVFQEEIANAVAIAASRNISNAIFFFVMAAALVFLLRAAGPERASGAT